MSDTYVRRNPVPPPPEPPLRDIRKDDFVTRDGGKTYPLIETEDGALWGYGLWDTWEFASLVNRYLSETADVRANFTRIDVDRAWATCDGVDEFGEFTFKIARGHYIPGRTAKTAFPVVVIRP